MSQFAAGPYVAGCLLLLAAGVMKLRRPGSTRRTLAAAGLQVPQWAVALLGLSEVILGLVAVANGGSMAALAVAACYLAFAGFAAMALRRSPGVDCGCFGDTAAPLGPLHLALNAAMALAALVVAGDGGLPAGLGARVAVAVPGAALAWVAYLAMVPLPRLTQVVRQARP